MTDNSILSDTQSESVSRTPAWGGVCVKLLQGPLYRSGADDANWNALSTWLSEINDYFSKIGLVALVNQSDGYAYLAQTDDHRAKAAVLGFEQSESDDERTGEDESGKIPRLIKKMPLSPELSMLCVLLREALDRFEAQEGSSALVLREGEIKEMLSPYLKSQNDQTRVLKRLDEYFSQLVRLTFIREVNEAENQAAQKEREFEIRRIIKSRIGPDFLAEFKRRLEAENEKNAGDGEK